MLQTPELPPSVPARRKAKPRRHAEWLKIIAQCKSSGLTEQAFCDSIGVKVDTFRKHRYQANKASGKKTSGRTGFKAVKITQSAVVDQAVIVLHAPGCRVVLPLDMDISRVAQLVCALGR